MVSDLFYLSYVVYVDKVKITFAVTDLLHVIVTHAQVKCWYYNIHFRNRIMNYKWWEEVVEWWTFIAWCCLIDYSVSYYIDVC